MVRLGKYELAAILISLRHCHSVQAASLQACEQACTLASSFHRLASKRVPLRLRASKLARPVQTVYRGVHPLHIVDLLAWETV